MKVHLINLLPKSEAIPAATIPRGPTQLMKSRSFSFKFEPQVLKNTANGLITNTTTANKMAVSQVYKSIRSLMLIFAASKMNKIDISKTLSDSLKYKSSLRFFNFPFPRTIPITTTANNPDS